MPPLWSRRVLGFLGAWRIESDTQQPPYPNFARAKRSLASCTSRAPCWLFSALPSAVAQGEASAPPPPAPPPPPPPGRLLFLLRSAGGPTAALLTRWKVALLSCAARSTSDLCREQAGSALSQHASSPQAAPSARAHARLPHASASLGQSAAWGARWPRPHWSWSRRSSGPAAAEP